MSDTLKQKYDRLARRVQRLKEELSMKAPALVINNELRLIKEAVDAIEKEISKIAR